MNVPLRTHPLILAGLALGVVAFVWDRLAAGQGVALAAIAAGVALVAFVARKSVPASKRFAPVQVLVVNPFLFVSAGLALVHFADDLLRPALLLSCGALWLVAWGAVEDLSRADLRERNEIAARRILTPALFGATLLLVWELLVVALFVSPVLLPPPSMIGVRFAGSTSILWADFLQTFQGVVVGYAIGCGSAFLTALAIDRSPFLQRGLLPIGNFVAALPIIGVAPIMVMWFGFDWQSKAAVVVVMCFFPMLVNTVEGLAAAERMQKDLMRTYAATYGQTLLKLRLPAAAPFIFNGLKICSTLALIGAIVAEFFGTPIVGMGFRISTEVGRMNLDMVWAEIAVAAIAGSAFYGAVALMERAVTFWHPSQRG